MRYGKWWLMMMAVSCMAYGATGAGGVKTSAASIPALNVTPANRESVLKLFAEREYGVRRVERPDSLRFDTAADCEIMDGKAIHRAVTIHADGPRAPFAFPAHAYLPKGGQIRGTFLLVYLGQRVRKDKFDPNDPHPSRHHFPIDYILSRGYAAVMFNNWEVATDDPRKCFESGVFKAWGPSSEAERTERDWGAISAWAWGASRVMDWIKTQPVLKDRRVAVIGHSRGGKTALWAGVTDSRFALACVNDSGCSGAKLNHLYLPKSESIAIINERFPHWFCKHYHAYNGREFEMDFDQHQLVALMAPRAVEVASATEDLWAGPEGERKSCELASAAWEPYGEKGFVPGGKVGYHLRPGPHSLEIFDWQRYIDFADRTF